MPGPVPGIHVFAARREGVDGRDKPGHDGRMDGCWPLCWSAPEALLDHDLAGHAEFGVGLAVAGLDVAAQVAGAAGCDRHQPPFGRLPRIDLDLADRALEFGERDGLAVL